MPTPEGRLRQQLRSRLTKYALLSGGRLKWWSNADVFTTGRPDMELIWNGLYAALELKSETGRPSPLQRKNGVDVSRAGGFSAIVRPGVNGELFLCETDNGVFEFSHVSELLDRVEQRANRTRL